MNEPKHISTFMDKIKDNIQKKYDTNKKIQKIDWRMIIGEKIARHTEIAFIKDNDIYVNVDSSAYLFQINLLKNQILVDINKYYPELKIFNLKLLLRNGG